VEQYLPQATEEDHDAHPFNSDSSRRSMRRSASSSRWRPFWRERVRLDNRKLVAALDHEPRTPLSEAVATTLRGLGAT
jgi:nucleoside-diphosphate-sugar epimerase